MSEMPDQINHPSHYGTEDDPYEVIKVMRAWLTREEMIGALKFNIHKYLARERKKGGVADMAKAAWYAAYLHDFTRETPATAPEPAVAPWPEGCPGRVQCGELGACSGYTKQCPHRRRDIRAEIAVHRENRA